MSSVSRENRAYLKRAWRHLLGTALWRHKGRAAIVFFTGFLTTLIQIFGVLMLIGAARAYDSGGILTQWPISFDLSETGGANRYIYAALTGAILVISILAGVGHKLIVTRIGRRFYQDLLDDTRLRLVNAVKQGRGFDRSSYLQYLSRDCRYLSLSYIRVMNLIQPALLLLSIFTISLITVPIAAAFLGVAGLLVLPLNIYLVLWAARTSQDIQASAKLKSKEEADLVASVSSNPFIANMDAKDLINPNRPGEQGFLAAFVKRQRMSAYSQSVTDLMMALVIIAAAAFLFFGGGNMLLLKLSSLVILVILFRFITSYISNLSQAVMMVSSYEPFFRPLLNLWSGEDTPHTLESFDTVLETPVRAAIFQAKKSDWSDASAIAQTLKLGCPLQIVTADFTPNIERTKDILSHSGGLNFSEAVRSELNGFTNGTSAELSTTAKLFLTLAYGMGREGAGFLIDGALLRVVYRAVPRRLVLPPRFQLLSRSPSSFSLICNAHEFMEKRDMIVEMMQDMPTTPTPTDDSPDDNAAIIV